MNYRPCRLADTFACDPRTSGPSSGNAEFHLTRDYTRCTLGAVDGGRLRQIRSRRGLTQVALAERLGVTANTVARWERNEVRIREPMERLIRLVTRPGKARR